MPNNFELVATLSIGAIFAASATALYPTVEKSWEFAKVAEKVREMPFTKFCGTDGSILSGSGRNCLEVPGYRFIRDGLGTVIAMVAQDGTATVVFRRDTPDDIGTAWDLNFAFKAIRRADRQSASLLLLADPGDKDSAR